MRGIWLGRTIQSDEHLFGSNEGVFTTRTVKRVPVTDQARTDLVKDLKGTPWDRYVGRPMGRPRKRGKAPQAMPILLPAAVEDQSPGDGGAAPA